MEPLRIRIPKVFCCAAESCPRYLHVENALCGRCFLNTRVGQKVTTATLPNKSDLVHRASLRSDLRT